MQVDKRGLRDLLIESGLFDAEWYERQLGEPLPSGIDPVEHFVAVGRRQGASPHPLFRGRWYASRAARQGARPHSPLEDFLRRGAREGLSCHPYFDAAFYLEQCPEAAEHPFGAVGHFLNEGARLGVVPQPAFDAGARMRRNPDAAVASPFLDFVRYAQGRLSAVTDRRSFVRESRSFDHPRAIAFAREHLAAARALADPPLVSVILPTQDRADHLRQSIRSVIGQSYRNWELIVVDDASTDVTPQFLAAYRDERIRVLRRNVSTGVAAARNAGLRLAQGRYVAYLDSDKTWMADFLAVMVTHLERTAYRAAYSAAELQTPGGPCWLGAEFELDALVEKNYIDCVTFVHERSLLDEVGAFDEELRRMVDWDLILRVARHTPLSFAPFVGSVYDPYDPRPDRITNRETKGWYWTVRAKHLLDWEALAAGLPERAAGRTSIVIPAYGSFRMTVRCVEAIFDNTDGDVEVVLVDNGSTGAAPFHFLHLEDRFPGVRVVRFAENQMFALGSDAGAAASTGDVIVFLNNDTLVTPGWLPPLRQGLDNGAAAVQPLLLYPDGTVQCAGVVFDPTGMPYHVFHDFPGDAPEVRTAAYRKALTAACVALRAETVITLRGFDCTYVNGFEDVDLFMRLSHAALGPCLFEPQSVVIHEESKTPGRGALIPENRALYSERWRRGEPVTDDAATWESAGYEVLTYGLSEATAREAGVAVWRPTVMRIRDRREHRQRWAIKIGAPKLVGREHWGDYHFAQGLAEALGRLGQEVVIDCKDAWYRSTAHLDDVVLVLRGLSGYGPSPDHFNLLWVISHPDLITPAEANNFDHVFAAGRQFADQLRADASVEVETLMQATDARRFAPGPADPSLSHDVLFVGNSRKVHRQVIQDAIAAGLPLSVYGQHWDEFLSSEIVQGLHVPNDQLPAYYRSAGVVLNDHWEDMRRYGFLSNRLFDLAACGARVISDSVPGLVDVFGHTVHTYDRPEDLGRLARRILADPDAGATERQRLAERVREEHSFDARAWRLLQVANDHAKAAARLA